MTDEEAINKYEDLKRMFPNVPNPEHEPRRFKAYVLMYKHIIQRRSNESSDV